jgi:hypothetical protein
MIGDSPSFGKFQLLGRRFRAIMLSIIFSVLRLSTRSWSIFELESIWNLRIRASKGIADVASQFRSTGAACRFFLRKVILQLK